MGIGVLLLLHLIIVSSVVSSHTDKYDTHEKKPYPDI